MRSWLASSCANGSSSSRLASGWTPSSTLLTRAPLVRSLPAELLYTTIQEVGLADSTELVQLASPAQFRTFVDLGAWKRDRIEPHAVLTWLRAARGDESEEFLRKLHGMDLEMLEYMLREFTAGARSGGEPGRQPRRGDDGDARGPLPHRVQGGGRGAGRRCG